MLLASDFPAWIQNVMEGMDGGKPSRGEKTNAPMRGIEAYGPGGT